MAIDALVSPLMRLPIFDGLGHEQLSSIVRVADRLMYRSGDVIATENQSADASIILISGRCFRLDAESPRGGDVVPEGSIIAELAMLVETQHAATIVAQSRIKALRLTRASMHALMEAEPTIADHFIARIVHRLKDMASSISALDEVMGRTLEAIPVSAYVSETPAGSLHSH